MLLHNQKTNTMKNLKELLSSNQIVELSNDKDVYEVDFSKIRNLFMLRKNGTIVATSKTLTSIEMRLPSNLEVTDLF